MIPSVPESPLPQATPRNDRLVALFLFAVVAIMPPLLRVFGGGVNVFGWPLLFLYIFCVWGGVVALIAVDVEFGERDKKEPGPGIGD